MAAKTEAPAKLADDIAESLRDVMSIARQTAELLRRYVYPSSISNEYSDSVDRRCRAIEARLGIEGK